MAGQPVMTGFRPGSGWKLVRLSDGAEVPPEPAGQRVAVPLRYKLVPKSGSPKDTGVELQYELRFRDGERPVAVNVTETITPVADGVDRFVETQSPKGYALSFDGDPARDLKPLLDGAAAQTGQLDPTAQQELSAHTTYRLSPAPARTPPIARPELPRNDSPVTSAPGFTGTRLKLSASIMPTALAWRPDGSLVFTSLKGHVYVAKDSDGDGLEDSLTPFAEGLAAPFGVLPDGDSLLVAHKPELLRLIDSDGDGRSDEWKIVADGWGYSDNYHDWTTGPVRDAEGNLYVAISSDYSQPGRDERTTQWRGKLLKVTQSAGQTLVAPYAHELRFPMGIAFDAKGRLFVSDQQGVQNTSNEIDHIVEGRRYGVPSLYDPQSELPETRAAVQVPHPMTRSVNGIFFIPTAPEGRDEKEVRGQRSEVGSPRQDSARNPTADVRPPTSHLSPFAGHGIGCEYNGKFLIRFSFQEVGGELQGATYYFTRNTWDDEQQTFLGPICGGVGPDGNLYIGSIHDSGWLGGLNVGEIVRLTPTGEFPNGIRELRAIPDGFEIEFLRPVDPKLAKNPQSYSLSGATRVWQGSYATEDSGQYQPRIESVELSGDARTVRLHVDRLEEKYVYDVAVKRIGVGGEELFPHTGHYSMNRVPKGEDR
jgi:glucose/arabinose dehydrogenase